MEGIVNTKLHNFITNPITTHAAVGIFTFGAGLVVGHILERRRKPKTISVMMEADTSEFEGKLAKVRDELNDIRAKRADRIPPVVIDAEEYEKVEQKKKVDNIVIETGYVEPEAEVLVNGEPVTHSVFADTDDDWDMDKEVRSRTPDRPYVVHRDEFFEEGNDYAQRQLTYYNGDNVLVDEENNPIDNHERVVGEMKFGHGSHDPNVVYIRNEKLNAEYEVFLQPGLYSIEIQGLHRELDQEDIQHSGVRRMPRE
jgi:hypothetical protein